MIRINSIREKKKGKKLIFESFCVTHCVHEQIPSAAAATATSIESDIEHCCLINFERRFDQQAIRRTFLCLILLFPSELTQLRVTRLLISSVSSIDSLLSPLSVSFSAARNRTEHEQISRFASSVVVVVVVVDDDDDDDDDDNNVIVVDCPTRLLVVDRCVWRRRTRLDAKENKTKQR
jgi:hypothetical protein